MTPIQILLFDGFDELDAITPLEILRRAERKSDLEVALVTVDDSVKVKAAFGLQVCVEQHFDSAQPPDILLVPGGGWNNRSEQGTWAEYKRGEIPDAITRSYRAGSTVASVCTGAMLLAKAGILAGRPAATHHSAREDLQKYDVELMNARVVDDGDVITAGGVTSGLDLALYLVERFADRDLANIIAEQIEYERRESVLVSH
jgi:transcriptional regulator GlxA family with amidase domain